jgi:hypothetical protein
MNESTVLSPIHDKNQMGSENRSWIGVDLDSTWADTTDPVHRRAPFPIGPEIAAVRTVIDRIHSTGELWLRGRKLAERIGQVKCFTARANDPTQLQMVRDWLTRVGLPHLEITAKKDFDMVWSLDDRAITVVPCTGQPLSVPSWGASSVD